MTAIFIRTIIIYLILIGTMRILGKRQLGELEVSELITTILLSEVASMPLVDRSIPLSHAVIPLVVISALEVAISYTTYKHPRLKALFFTPPSTLVRGGVINQRELAKNRIAPEELITELRLQGYSDIRKVNYAILEQNGLLSVIPKASEQPPTMRDLKLQASESGIIHVIISQGEWNDLGLRALSRDRSEFEAYLKSRGAAAESVFLLTVDDGGTKSLVLKEGKQ